MPPEVASANANTSRDGTARFPVGRLFAVLITLSVIRSPAFAQDGSRDLATFFSGHLTASGQFQNLFSGGTRGVQVDIHGAPEPGGFKLIEDIVYSDGEKHRWLWRFTKMAEGRYVGEGTDLIGVAKIEAQGNTIDIAYRAHFLTKDGATHDLDFRQTYIFSQSGTVDMRLSVSLLFVPLGEAHLTVRKLAN